jgi:hypothetical protein
MMNQFVGFKGYLRILGIDSALRNAGVKGRRYRLDW